MSPAQGHAEAPPLDAFRRPLRNLRISVTDRCNLRCAYCMPEEEYTWLPRRDILTFEELSALVDVFASLGADRVRITGGEPLLRRDLPALLALIAAKPALRDLALTTNGILLADQAAALRAAGLHRVSVSLDTLRPHRFRELTRRDELSRVLAGLAEVQRLGFSSTKIDTVVLRGTNDDELTDLLELGREREAEVRFIEYMDVGGATQWSMDDVVPRAEMLAGLAAEHGPIEPVEEQSSAPADRFRITSGPLAGTVFGIISSTTAPFCSTCDRSRLTADGMWLTCLYATRGRDLRGPLRAGASPEELRTLIAGGWAARTDRGAEERLARAERSALAEAEDLRRDPHLEMHTRGG